MDRALTNTTVTTLLLIAVAGCAAHQHLAVTLGAPHVYQDDQGHRFIARYGQLSDNSLHFVKVTMPGGRQYTLPQAMSASGARYTDDRELVWWEHQGTVRVDGRDSDGRWVTRYLALKPVPAKRW